MIDEPSGMLLRRQLGAQVRRLRVERGWTLAVLADHLSCSESKVSRIESGARKVTPADLARLVQIFELDAEARAQLAELQEGSRRRDPAGSVTALATDYTTLEQNSFLGLEHSASEIREYNSGVIPGLLQVPRYVEASMRGSAPDVDEHDLRRAVQLRLRRQQILRRDDPPYFEAIIDESALARVVGGWRVMRQQLTSLLDALDSGRSILRVIPFERGAHPGVNSDFVSLVMPNPAVPDVVFVEGLLGHVRIDDRSQLDRYQRVWDRLVLVAEDARPVIERHLAVAEDRSTKTGT